MNDASANLDQWIGSREVLDDVVGAAPVIGLSATLDRDEPPPATGGAVPPGWHWLYFLPRARQSVLSVDGHPRRGDFLPPIMLPRRMIAGGRMTFHRPLRIGEAIRREGEVIAIRERTGRSGELVIVTVRYRITDADGLAVEEEQDIVYREAARDVEAPPGEPAEVREDDWRRVIQPDPVLLFRFSALTFNGHRIHYDRPYVTGIEGYPGLVVHGPLTAILLLELCRDNTRTRPLADFRFRAKRPLFDTAPFTLAGRLDDDGRGCALQAVDGDGCVAMEATATFAS